MDYNTFPVGVAMGTLAMDRYHAMTEAQKEDLMFRCRDAKSADEIEKIMDSVEDADVSSLTDPMDTIHGFKID